MNKIRYQGPWSRGQIEIEIGAQDINYGSGYFTHIETARGFINIMVNMLVNLTNNGFN